MVDNTISFNGVITHDLEFRKELAFAFCPAGELYTDDGELQDNRANPHIDFKRDSAAQILSKIQTRVTANANVEKQLQPLTDDQLLEVCRKQTNHRAVEMFGDAFLRISQAVQRELLESEFIQSYGYVLRSGHGDAFRTTLEGVHPVMHHLWVKVFRYKHTA